LTVAEFNINLNVTHNYIDNNICVVAAISDCIGGGLCLLELGPIVDWHCGDLIIFKSSELTHFNMHYQGWQASSVLHSDKRADIWVENGNGWKHNIFMNTYEPGDVGFGL
jgi:hypothetical protein